MSEGRLSPLTTAGARPPGSLFRNTVWLAGGRVASHLMAIPLTVVLARGLGTAGFGQYAFVGAVVVIGNVISTFGTESLLVREIAGQRGDPARLLGAALGLQLVLAAAFVLVVLPGAGWLPNRTGDVIAALRIWSLVLFPLAFTSVFAAALRGWERMDLVTVLSVGTAALQTVAALVALRAGAHLPALMASLLVIQVVAAVFGWIVCRIARPGFRLVVATAPAVLTTILRQAWPFALLAGLPMLSQRIGLVLITFLAGDAPAGWFAAAARVIEGLKLTHYSFLGAFLPFASRVGARGAAGGDDTPETANAWLTTMVRKSQLVLVGLALGAAVAANLLAAPVVSLLFGGAYHPTVTALRILAWALLPYAAAGPTSLALISTGHEGVVLRAGSIAVIVTAALGVWLIPGWGVNGACIAALAGEMVRCALLLFESGRIAAPRLTSAGV